MADSTVFGSDLVLDEVSSLEDPRLDSRHLPALDGLRGLAILAVILFHFGVLSGGYFGVDVFFVVSGFVVSNNIIRRSQTPRWLRVFWVRRFSRLVPVLAAFVLVLAAAWSLDGDVSSAQASGLVSGLLMQYNLADVLLGAGGLGLVPLWSLSVEFHFYVLAPAALLLDGSFASLKQPATRSCRRAATFVAAAGLVAVMRVGLITTTDISDRFIYLSSVTRLDGLLLGASLAVLPFVFVRRMHGSALAWPAFIGLVAVLGFAPRWFDAPALTMGPVSLALHMSVVALIIAILLGRLPPTIDLALSSRLLTLIGQRSYSLYLWHFLIGVVLLAGGAESFQGPLPFVQQLVASAVVSEISYRMIEVPARSAINRRVGV